MTSAAQKAQRFCVVPPAFRQKLGWRCASRRQSGLTLEEKQSIIAAYAACTVMQPGGNSYDAKRGIYPDLQ